MFHDLKHHTFYRMVMTGWHSGGLPEGSEMYFGQKQIASAGTAVRLKAASTPLRGGVLLRLEDYDNADDVVYAACDRTVSDSTGVIVDQFQPVFIEVNNLSEVWINCASDLDISDGVGVSYMAF